MNILILASHAPSLLNFRGPLIRELIASGHTVCVGAPDVNSFTRDALERLGAKVYETPLERNGLSILNDLVYLRNLLALVREIQPALMLTYTIKPNIWGAFAAARAGVPSIAMVTGLGYAFTDGSNKTIKQHIIKFFARWLYRGATNRNVRVIFQNPDDRDDFNAAGCLKDLSKVRMVNGSGVDLILFQPAPLPDTPDFLMISRILGAKGVREYARAAIEVKRTHPLARFRLVGFFDTGPDAVSPDEINDWVAQGLEYLGRSEDVRPHLAACRVYVLPSYREGTPRSVLEAMATGRAIVTSDAPGCRETVKDGVNGFLTPVRDSVALADKMRWMIDNPSACAAMAEESLRIVREKYDVHKVNETLLRHLDVDV
jgi:glycosyltransferase involved in cell wall biosynthesis